MLSMVIGVPSRLKRLMPICPVAASNSNVISQPAPGIEPSVMSEADTLKTDGS